MHVRKPINGESVSDGSSLLLLDFSLFHVVRLHLRCKLKRCWLRILSTSVAL